ncbi:hypothetical protein SOVF_034520 [Spinacia oleracea]|uniref:Probable disease resistance protein At1g52660 n=1 Tax=Spinacia oleracea TaxID=3562 RepID=A0A9R0ICP5_SPIOL|nr:probable disease resistance protein At1g52660 [Spinacia oleracea]XP_021845704.1 probable disease resistance protein At1g52660 [Spinacia oleracea]KNA22367.1 hypothetical protein SOVF_034520 [Spinacia oleracea]
MVCTAIFLGIWGLLTYLSGEASLDERKRILMDETESLTARMQDIQREISSTQVQRGKKRKRDDCHWMTEGQKLVDEGERLLRQVGRWRCFLLGAKIRWDVCKLVNALKVHDKKGDVLLKHALSDARGVCRGYHIPVEQLFGQVASEAFNHLKLLLEDDIIGRIAIHGIRGIGKTFLMKHIHNYALNRFDYVFWVPSPVEFTIKCVQDAVAAVVKCDFACDDDLFVRASKLSGTLAKLGSFALFLDCVPKADFSLEQVGIPVPRESSKCKVVLSTSSTLECKILDCFETVEIERLLKEDAYELFMHKANIGKESVSSLDGFPSLLADRCCGVPQMIENVASRMCSIDDPREWKCALFEFNGVVPLR